MTVSRKLRLMGIDEDFAGGPGKHPWVIGGSLLLASVVIGMAAQPLGAPISLLGPIAASAALVVFALGFHARGGVTGKHRAGTIALCALAVWTLSAALFSAFFSQVIITGSPALGFLNEIISLTLAMIVVVTIGKSDAVPHPWNWVPAVALASWVALWLIEQMLREAVLTSALLSSALLTLGALIHLGTPVFLGATAIALANRTGTRPALDEDVLNPGAVLSVLDGVIQDALAAEALISRLGNQQRPTSSDARQGQQLRFALAKADRALAASGFAPAHRAEVDEARRTVAYYQHMIKHSFELGFSAILAEPPHLKPDGGAPLNRVDRLAQIRQSLSTDSSAILSDTSTHM